MLKRIIAVFAAMTILLTCCSCGFIADKSTVQIRILKIGKADAIIIKTPRHAVLIDAGEEDDGEEIAENLADMRIGRLDYLIITHYDKDHIGGAAEVMASVEIGEILEPGYKKESALYDNYVITADAMNIMRTVPDKNISFTFDDAEFDIIMPKKPLYDDENDSSIVTRLTYGKNVLMFLGDANAERLLELMTEYDISADLVKAAHHGNYNDLTDSFYDKMAPKYAVITCSDKNPPDKKTLECFKRLGCKAVKTSNGDVTVKLTPDSLKVYQ